MPAFTCPDEVILRHFLRDGGEFLRGQAFSLLIGKVDGKAYPLPQVFQPAAQLLHLAAEKPVELGGSQVYALARGRGDEFRHGFGLGEIHAAVQKGAPGEFPPLGHARAPGKHGVEQRGKHGHTAMPLYFGAVFSGKGMGGLEEYGKGVVGFAVLSIQHTAVMQHARREIAEGGGGGAEHGKKNVVRLRPRYADDAHPARSGSGGYGRDGVGIGSEIDGAHFSSSARIMEERAGSSQIFAATS